MSKGYVRSPLFDFCWFKDFETALRELAGLAMAELWDYQQSPCITPSKRFWRRVRSCLKPNLLFSIPVW